MAIDVNRTLMQGKLAGLKEEKARLKIKAIGLCSGIITTLNPALNPPEEMDIAQAANQMVDLEETNIDLLEALTQIQQLQKALHG